MANKTKTKKNDDIYGMISTMQGQLAVLDKKFDDFMTKSLTELAQAMAAAKQAPVRSVIMQQPAKTQQTERQERPMYAVVCYACGEDCEIPFKPSGNRPVFCKACFAKRKEQNRIARPAPLSLSSTTVTSTIVSKEPGKNSKSTKKAAKKKPVTKRKNVQKSSVKKNTAKKKNALKKKAPKKK